MLVLCGTIYPPHLRIDYHKHGLLCALSLHKPILQHYLGDTVAVPEDDANLGRGQALLGQLEDLFLDVVGGELQPVGNGAAIGERRLRDALAGRVHTTHDEPGMRDKTNLMQIYFLMADFIDF